MSDRPTSGPAPRWGEYAPVPEQPPVPPIAEKQAAPAERDFTQFAPPPADAKPGAPAETDAAKGPKPVRLWDRSLTFGLIALAVLNVLFSIPSNLDLASTLDAFIRTAGFGAYTSDSLATGIGIANNVINVSLLILAVLLSTASLRAGRLTFWIPLTIGAVATIAVGVLVAVAMLSDPAFVAYLDQQRSAGATPAP
ncbi:DUF6264 family protein [Amnibacterium flavum]|uniref:Uncharacterized protein n=1 Tax=Amnibacterium flavum TaxID=2173173 RepID=A0A2V1HUF8_9MICO|nr:DUF6264 family protein [Amnibacterium flavum]PVZ93724.1 hypothetical protein DDQ50_07965 [Amnibacterium flavum]